MSYREVPPLRAGGEVVDEPLRDALNRAEDEPLPAQARLSRIRNNVLTQIASADRARSNDEMRDLSHNEAGRSVKRPSKKTHIRFASAKIGLAALVGMGAAWSSVTGYRAYFEKAPVAPAPLPAAGRTASHVLSPLPFSVAQIDAPPHSPEESSPISDEKPASSAKVFLISHPGEVPIVAPSAQPSKNSGKPSAAPAPITIAQRPAAESASPEPPSPAEIAATNTLPELEEDMLERARQTLRGDPQTALAVTDTHRRLYAAGRLTQEREVIAIQALTKLKRFDAARARAVLFLSEHPESPYANDIRAIATAALR